MEATEQISRMQDFLDSKRALIAEHIRKRENWLEIEFADFAMRDPELAEAFLDSPEDILKAGEIAIKQMDFAVDRFYLRFRELPASSEVKIREIRSEHLGKVMRLDGIVRQKSDVRPQMKLVKFECAQCANVLSIPQSESKIKEPARCSACGYRGKFRQIDKELYDVQGIVLEENSEKLDGGEQPKRINLFLKEDLVSPLGDKMTNPGSNIIVTGVLKEVAMEVRGGGQSTKFDLIIEANHIEQKQSSFHDLEISKTEEEQIIELSKSPTIFEDLATSIAPSIYGYEFIKKALLLQQFGGINKKRSDGVITRGDMHVLLIGDPGAGKSQLLKRCHIVAPRSRYVSGKGASGAGLTAAVVKDEFLGGWSLEAGALVLASDGLCCIDELDKMTTEDRSAMHEALEQQTISISKANIQATLTCKTTVLAAANPKFGRFDPYTPIVNQIDLPPPLISRFDLIFPIRDIPDYEDDAAKAKYILSLHKNPIIKDPKVETDLLRKYIAYSKRIDPQLTDGAIDEIQRYYVDIRNRGNSGEGGVKSVPITARQLEALVRLSESYARLQLLDKVGRKEAKTAVELLHNCLSLVGVDPETGKIDTDIISSGISSSQRGKIISVKEILNDLEKRDGKEISVEKLIEEAAARDISKEACEQAIEKLKRGGDIYEPKHGFIQRL